MLLFTFSYYQQHVTSQLLQLLESPFPFQQPQQPQVCIIIHIINILEFMKSPYRLRET